MFRAGSFFLRALLALVLLAAVVGGGALAFQAGYNQGYAQGAAVTLDGDGPQVLPSVPLRPGMFPFAMPYHYGFFAPFHFGGVFFCGGLIFLLLLVFAFRPRPWRHAAMWAHHGPWGPPPWAQGQQPPASPQAESKANNDKGEAA